MSLLKVLIISGFGINCEVETASAFQKLGVSSQIIHVTDLIKDPTVLKEAKILVFPGGFSFGDHIASGKIMASFLKSQLKDELLAFAEGDKLILGICNGFQIMVKMGLLPHKNFNDQCLSITYNDNGKFLNTWVNLAVNTDSSCVWLKGLSNLKLPIRHGEGKLVSKDQSTIDALWNTGQAALFYSEQTKDQLPYPLNPNGSMYNIAGICDSTGKIFGLMPHPEACVLHEHYPQLTDQDKLLHEPYGLSLLRNGVNYFK